MTIQNKNMRSIQSGKERATLNRFPLVGLAMLLTSAAAAGYGIVYCCFTLAGW